MSVSWSPDGKWIALGTDYSDYDRSLQLTFGYYISAIATNQRAHHHCLTLPMHAILAHMRSGPLLHHEAL